LDHDSVNTFEIKISNEEQWQECVFEF